MTVGLAGRTLDTPVFHWNLLVLVLRLLALELDILAYISAIGRLRKSLSQQAEGIGPIFGRLRKVLRTSMTMSPKSSALTKFIQEILLTEQKRRILKQIDPP